MNLINFSKANCRNCYKCLRRCPVKAIQFKNEQAGIIEDRCIACGQCLIACPQNARYIKSDIDITKSAIKSNKKVCASIAPSFAGAFEMENSGQLVTALHMLGFDFVEETAIGAQKITSEYNEYIIRKRPENIITTCCPSANYLIEKYYPSLVKYMLPFVSPMLAHGKMMRYSYGMDSFIVFIGPCTAKKNEIIEFEHEGTIDAVLTFEELSEWLDNEKIDLKTLKPSDFEAKSNAEGRIYPIRGGVLQGIIDLKTPYAKISVDGIENCMEAFDELQSKKLSRVCIEANACTGGCIKGPGMPKSAKNFYFQTLKVKKYTSENKKSLNEYKHDKDHIESSISFSKLFSDMSIQRKKASEEEISNILKTMGKFEPEDELNCGVCGYNTCREKAEAIYEGMAEVTMCLHYMRTRAESLTNTIFENSPNIIIILNTDMTVKEFSPAAEAAFKINAKDIAGKPISSIIDDESFLSVKETGKDIIGKKIELKNESMFLLNVLYLKKQNAVLVIMNDITLDEKHKQELKKVKENTLDAAQAVIDKQMRVAQEIASLLGETTAETKVILTKLKKIAEKEGRDV
ncbi:MAG TPA: hydrogenase [Clostridiaceae bacterium]|nr:hydrogenase [Clostridiaceae bacterium]